MSSTPSSPRPGPSSLRSRSIIWIGGVVRIGGMPGQRVAAWITSAGRVVDAAIVDGHGPTVLGEMLGELLQRVPADQRPDELVVWPADRAAVGGLQFPPVTLERDGFLKVVVWDQWYAGAYPDRLSVRCARAPKGSSTGGRKATS